jgi:hypothetical protein
MAARFGGSAYREHVACAGTIVGTLSEAGVDVERKEEHRVAVGSKVKRARCLAEATPG